MEVPFFFRRLWPLSAVRCRLSFVRPLSALLCLLSASLAVAGVPSPRGLVRADLRFDGGRVAGTVTLPEGLPGVFAWQGVETPLSPGANRIAR